MHLAALRFIMHIIFSESYLISSHLISLLLFSSSPSSMDPSASASASASPALSVSLSLSSSVPSSAISSSPNSSLLLSKIAQERARQAEKRKPSFERSHSDSSFSSFLSCSVLVSGLAEPVNEADARQLVGEFGAVKSITINTATQREFVASFDGLESAMIAVKAMADGASAKAEFIRDEDIPAVKNGSYQSSQAEQSQTADGTEPERKRARLVVVKRSEIEKDRENETKQPPPPTVFRLTGSEECAAGELPKADNSAPQWEVYWAMAQPAEQEANERRIRTRKEAKREIQERQTNHNNQVN